MNTFALFKELDIQLASAKRSVTERKGVHAWHPYYAGYSEQFVESALAYLNCGLGSVVADPWAGSGTTGFVASRAGVDSVCLDINPVMATFAAAKSNSILKVRSEIEAWLRALPSRPSNSAWPVDPEPLAGIFDAVTAAHLRRVLRAIPFGEYLSPSTSVLKNDAARTVLDPCYAFCRAVVFVTLRKLSGTQKLQNPTWLRTEAAEVHVSERDLLAALRVNAETMLRQLCEVYGGTVGGGTLNALCGDARALPLKNASVDAVITSPPYLTRIDYAVSTLPEMLTFGDDVLLESIRHKTMGAPVITKVERAQNAKWGPLCNEILNAVRSHPTKAAASYYWKNIVQYFMDMDASLQEIKRILKPGAGALVVVQSSYFKDIEIPLGDIYVQAAEGLGLKAGIAAREKVKTHMAHVNTRSTIYKANKVYYEDVVEIRRYA
ncbi:hypothetical protein KXR53_21095 [Inquilinus limosus]|uniref:hypothetical protein n=1 Tax=Inquilinus limosus TaxID=171674 RepID=UPI003F14943F